MGWITLGEHIGHGHGHHEGTGCIAEASLRVPAMRYQKDPVLTLNDLYKIYPMGGQDGWYAFVVDKGCFARWVEKENKWKLFAAPKEAILETLGLSASTMINNVLIGYSNNEFVPIKQWETEEY